jgi:hypothetical protein
MDDVVNLHEEVLDFEEIKENLKRFENESSVVTSLENPKNIPEYCRSLEGKIRKLESESVEDCLVYVLIFLILFF